MLLDPWILFWQISENNKRRSAAIHSAMAACGPGLCVGDTITFAPTGAAGVLGNQLRYHWTFGDGGHSLQAHPTHVFGQPGMYPVTLVVSDGTEMAATTQHISVSLAAPAAAPVLALQAPDEVELGLRPAAVLDVYGVGPRFLPHTLRFVAHPQDFPRSGPKHVTLEEFGLCRIGQRRGPNRIW